MLQHCRPTSTGDDEDFIAWIGQVKAHVENEGAGGGNDEDACEEAVETPAPAGAPAGAPAPAKVQTLNAKPPEDASVLSSETAGDKPDWLMSAQVHKEFRHPARDSRAAGNTHLNLRELAAMRGALTQAPKPPELFELVPQPGYKPPLLKRRADVQLCRSEADAAPLEESVAPHLAVPKRAMRLDEAEEYERVLRVKKLTEAIEEYDKEERMAKKALRDDYEASRHRHRPRSMRWADLRVKQVHHFLEYVLADDSQWGGFLTPGMQEEANKMCGIAATYVYKYDQKSATKETASAPLWAIFLSQEAFARATMPPYDWRVRDSVVRDKISFERLACVYEAVQAKHTYNREKHLDSVMEDLKTDKERTTGVMRTIVSHSLGNKRDKIEEKANYLDECLRAMGDRGIRDNVRRLRTPPAEVKRAVDLTVDSMSARRAVRNANHAIWD